MQILIASRKRNVLIYQEAGQKRTCKSISQAKKESWKIQKANGGLGCGAVQLI